MTERDTPPSRMRPDLLEPLDARWIAIEPGIFRYVRANVKSADLAREVVQQVYMRLRKCSNAATILHLESYARKVANNVIAELHRDRKRRERLHSRLEAIQGASRGDAEQHTPDAIADRRQRLERAFHEIDRLPEQTRRVFEAKTFSGESANSIAKRLGIDLRTVYRRLAHARKRLREALGLARGRKP